MTRVVVDPLTRIEGHLRVAAEVDQNGIITEAKSSGMLFRGLERILIGRDPRDAARYTQRVCGVCPTGHALAAANALDDLFGVADQIPKDALVTRNILQCLNTLASHATNIYALWAPDIVNPAYRDALSSKGDIGNAVWKELVGRFAPISYKLNGVAIPPGTSWVGAIKEKKRLEEAMALIGGRMPHQMSTVAGGVTYPPTVADIGKLASYYLDVMNFVNGTVLGVDTKTWLDNTFRATSPQKAVDFVIEHLKGLLNKSLSSKDFSLAAGWGDVPLLAAFGSELVGEKLLGLPVSYKLDKIGGYSKDSNVGFISFGLFYDVANGDGYEPSTWGEKAFIKSGFVTSDLKKQKFDQKLVTEETSHGFYGGNQGDLHPLQGITEPVKTAAEIEYDRPSTEKYTWFKAPRYNGLPAEAGPLARMLAIDEPLVTGLANAMAANGYSPANVFTRVLARCQEFLIITEQLFKHVTTDLNPNGKYNVHVDMGMGAERQGIGLWEAPRGAIGHWVNADSAGKISSYQMIIPTGWNLSPRDAKGIPGPMEQCLVGNKISAIDNLKLDFANPTTIFHTARSFDPCISCAIHTIDLTHKNKNQTHRII